MKIFITGGAGFIGSHLVEFHLKKGDEVFVLDNLSTGSEKNIAPFQHHPKFSFEHNNILTWDGLLQQTMWADRIYHLAAMVGMFHLLAYPIDTLETNILGCERLLRVMTQGRSKARLLVASSSEIYGPTDKELLNENDLLLFKSSSHSKWVYATSKFTEEILCLTYARSKEIQVTLIRYGMVVPRFVEQAICNQPMTVYGTGEQKRSFCDVRDTVAALDIIATNPALIGEIINLGQDQPISINNLAILIKGLANSASTITHVPYREAYAENYEDIMNRRPDLTKFHQYTSYRFQWDLKRTLLDLIQSSLS